MNTERKAYLYFATPDGFNLPLGVLFASMIDGKEIHSFQYDASALKEPFFQSFLLDPDLSVYPERQFLAPDKETFGFLSDSSPDRWGRLLLQRQENDLARKEQRRPRALSEFDYLVGVNDASRMGCLRIKLDQQGPFVSSSSFATPPMTSLRELEDIARAIEENKPIEDKKLQMLLSPGSSLGGARPKSSVLSPEQELWIAKFPSKNDSYDVASFEMVAHDLASLCGLKVPEARWARFSSYGHTFLSKRFDRQGTKRLPFSSALALLGKKDGEEASYLDLVSLILTLGGNPLADLKELYRRLIFNIVIVNTDDHLRNHGFLCEGKNWVLSPAYDLNPNPNKDQLTLSLDGVSHDLDLNRALKEAPRFHLQAGEAEGITFQIQETIKKNYFSLCQHYEIAREDAEKMAAYFHW
jgi:serine/threonine-protein kinase HipA